MDRLKERSLRPVVGRGFSLVELLVAIAIGLVIVAATTSMLVSSNRSNAELARSGQINESGRFALQIMGDAVARAGFWGGWIPGFDDLRTTGTPTDYPAAVPAGTTVDVATSTNTPAIPNPCKSYTYWSAQYRTNIIAIPVQVYDAVPAGCSAIVTNLQSGTDVLVVRGVEPCVAGSAGCTSLSAGEVILQRGLAFSAGKCASTATYVMSSASADLNLRKISCTTAASAVSCNCDSSADGFRYVSTIFYVRDYSVTAGDGIPTLMMSQFGLSGATIQHNTAQAIIPGVQGFRVDVGIDNLSKSGGTVDQTQAVSWVDSTNLTSPTNRGDGLPDAWTRCTTASPCTVAQLTNAVALRLSVLVRSETVTSGYSDTKTYTLGAASAAGPFNDSFRRRVYTQTVRLNNVAIRRETP